MSGVRPDDRIESPDRRQEDLSDEDWVDNPQIVLIRMSRKFPRRNRSSRCQGVRERRLVTCIFASWNQTAAWLRRLDGLQAAA
jgi:hypothetical protein